MSKREKFRIGELVLLSSHDDYKVSCGWKVKDVENTEGNVIQTHMFPDGMIGMYLGNYVYPEYKKNDNNGYNMEIWEKDIKVLLNTTIYLFQSAHVRKIENDRK